MVRESWFICPICADLVTKSEILERAEKSGANDMCYCPFTQPFWNEEFNELDVETNRKFQPYTEISKKWYDILSIEKNAVLRLDRFKQIPKKHLKDKR